MGRPPTTGHPTFGRVPYRYQAYNSHVRRERTPLEELVSSAFKGNASISVRLQNVTNELRQIQDMLILEEDADPRILTDFRDALNRVRNTAWAVEQYANSKTTDTAPQTVLSVLAGERIRVAYQLCKLVQADLVNREIRFQVGQVLQLRDAARELGIQIDTEVGE